MTSLRDSALALAERAAEVQDVLDDARHGTLSRETAYERIRAVMAEEGLLRAMHEVGYFPENAPPPGTLGH
jgi:hypothetical protein